MLWPSCLCQHGNQCQGFRTSGLDACFSQMVHKSAQLPFSETSPAACSVDYQNSYPK